MGLWLDPQRFLRMVAKQGGFMANERRELWLGIVLISVNFVPSVFGLRRRFSESLHKFTGSVKFKTVTVLDSDLEISGCFQAS